VEMAATGVAQVADAVIEAEPRTITSRELAERSLEEG